MVILDISLLFFLLYSRFGSRYPVAHKPAGRLLSTGMIVPYRVVYILILLTVGFTMRSDLFNAGEMVILSFVLITKYRIFLHTTGRI